MSLLHMFVEKMFACSSDEKEAAIVSETDHSKPVSHMVADEPKLVSYTDSRRLPR